MRAAIDIADAEGLAALSMRRLATQLDVAVMSLYRHVNGKDDLFLRMVDHVFAGAPMPADAPADWRGRLELLARTQWALCRRHPWMAGVTSFTRPMLAPHGMLHTEWTMRSMHDAGLDVAASLYCAVTLTSFVLGLAGSVQLEAEAVQVTGVDSHEWMEAQGEAFAAIAASGDYPTLAAVADVPDFDLDLDVIFEFGLRVILDGFAGLIESREP